MLDIFIIVIFVSLIISNLLKAFKWFQEKFNIYGTTIRNKQNLDLESTSQSKQKQKSLIKQIKNIKDTIKDTKRSQPSPFQKEVNNLMQKKQTRNISPVPKRYQQQNSAQLINLQSQLNKALKQNQNLQIKNKQLIEQKNKILITKSLQLKSNQSNQSYKIDKRIQQLNEQNNNLNIKLCQFQNRLQNQRLNVDDLTNQLFQVKKQSDLLINQMRQKLFKQLQQQKVHIQTRNQLQKMIKQCSDTQDKQNNLNEQKNKQCSKNQLISLLQTKYEQIKSELQFCQKQIQQYGQNQNKLKQQINKLNEQKQHHKIKSKKQIGINDVVNHPEYQRIKERLTKYQNGGLNSSRPKSIIRTQFTPQGQRNSSTTASRISQRKSLISSKYTSQILSDKGQLKDDELFAQCNFLNQQNKCFILDEIKKIKKLSIKKTKLIFKLEKLHPTNPHDFIDNIPNIIILIQLTNKKILGAFTQTAFCKDQVQLGITDKSPLKSRFGSNKALIIDLTNKLVFPNNSANDTIIYDESAIIWGKEQLVIKNDEPTLLYSSFGKDNSVYSDGKYTLQELLGGSQGFERINQYQVHRVYIS